MQNINVYIKENLKPVSSNVFIAPDIPEKKLNNAAKSLGLVDEINSIISIYDNTAFGSAKDGFAITGEKIVIKNMFEDPFTVNFENIETVTYIKSVEKKNNGKEKVSEFVKFIYKDGSTSKLGSLLSCNYELLAEVLNNAIKNADSFKAENQIVTLSEMSEDLKIAYVKAIINMAFSDDGLVDEKEFAEILLLMTRLELKTESRFELRSYITDDGNHVQLETLLQTIKSEAVPSHVKSIKLSLVKDLISTDISAKFDKEEFVKQYRDFYKKSDEERIKIATELTENMDYLNQHRELFGVSDEAISVLVQAIIQDFMMLLNEFPDEALVKSMKELTAKAGAVGVPLAAVYLSGSVIGMSAAGLTSGLATLGLGGALGFSSMATGIGVAVLLGVGAYKGIQHLTGANEIDKNKRRELMLNEVIKQTQGTISLLIDDLNFITAKLNDAIQNHSIQDTKIQKLMKMVSAMTSAGDVLNQKSIKTQNSYIKLRCPVELDQDKLKSLTIEPSKQQFYNLVLSFYENKEVIKEEEAVTVLKMKEDIPTVQLDKLAKIFEAIGYFKASDVIKGKVAGLFS